MPKSSHKKILIITYYWPPAGGGGVQRWLKFVKYLPDFGWEPIVYVPKNPEYPITDQSLQKEVSPDLTILKQPIWEPYQLFKKITRRQKSEKVNAGLLFDDKKKSFAERLSIWIRGNLLIPDPRVFWVRPSVKYLTKYLETHPVDVLVTTGPPHSLHLIGQKLQQRTGIKWLADFRDPWTAIDYFEVFKPSPLARKKQQKLERNVLQKADWVVTVSPSWAADLEKIGGRKVDVITNGFDETDFKAPDITPNPDKFIITYAGFLNSLRNPESLWQVLNELCMEDEAFNAKLEIRMFGTIDLGVQEFISNLTHLNKKVLYKGYVSHDQLMQEYYAANCLLLLQNQSTVAKGHIPGKLFEYLASCTPILALGIREGDVDELLQKTQRGILCDWNHQMEIQEALLKLMRKKSIQSKEISGFSRRELTKKLVQTIT